MIGRAAGVVPEILIPDISLVFTVLLSLSNCEVIFFAATVYKILKDI
jgi:hypothetical protein